MSASVLSRLLIVPDSGHSQFTELDPASRQDLDQFPGPIRHLKHPILRANPFPEVTDLTCRIPLSTLFYRPEAANLGDLMRLWVRIDVIR